MAWRLCGWDFHNLDIRKLYRQFQAWALQNDDDDDDDDDAICNLQWLMMVVDRRLDLSQEQ